MRRTWQQGYLSGLQTRSGGSGSLFKMSFVDGKNEQNALICVCLAGHRLVAVAVGTTQDLVGFTGLAAVVVESAKKRSGSSHPVGQSVIQSHERYRVDEPMEKIQGLEDQRPKGRSRVTSAGSEGVILHG